MAILGLVYLILIFLLCFTAVHIVKLTAIGFKSMKKKKEPKPEPKPVKVKAPEPVYYIVEKKRSRKATYSEPKQIKFKD